MKFLVRVAVAVALLVAMVISFTLYSSSSSSSSSSSPVVHSSSRSSSGGNEARADVTIATITTTTTPTVEKDSFFDTDCNVPSRTEPWGTPPGRKWGHADRGFSLVQNSPNFSARAMMSQSGIRRLADWLPFTRKVHSVRPKIAILTVSTRRNVNSMKNDDRRKLGTFSFASKMQYCAEHGYDLIWEDDSVLPGGFKRPAAWSKVFALQKWLPKYEWVLWMDLDTIFVNFNHSIESVIAKARADQDFILTVQPSSAQLWKLWPDPRSAMNTGIMFVRNTRFSMDFLARTLSDVHSSDTKFRNFEQDAISALIGARNEDWKKQCSKNKVESMLKYRRKFLVLHEKRDPAAPFADAGWNTFLYESLVRFDVSVGWPVARAWGFDASNPRQVVLHFVSCRRMPRCILWVEYHYRSAVVRKVRGGHGGAFFEPCALSRDLLRDEEMREKATQMGECAPKRAPRVFYPPNLG